MSTTKIVNEATGEIVYEGSVENSIAVLEVLEAAAEFDGTTYTVITDAVDVAVFCKA